MRVLLTGAFGNIGQDVIPLLLESGHEVICFDVETKKNKRSRQTISRRFPDRSTFRTVWGDIRRPEAVQGVVKDVDAILHLAGVIPPASEKDPNLARQVNVDGIRFLIAAAQAQSPSPRFIFSSSVSVYGPRMSDPPPRRADERVNPTDNYTRHKVECEGMVRESGLPWTILRIGVVLVRDFAGAFDPIVFDIPLAQRMEVIHSLDAAQACVNCLSTDVQERILLIGGGKQCRMLQRDFIGELMEAAGVGRFPDSAFFVPQQDSDWYYTDYLDSEESQALLHYQVHTFDDYLEELKKGLGFRRHLARALRPLVRSVLTRMSPHDKQ